MHFRVYGITLASTIPLPELTRSTAVTPALTFELRRGEAVRAGWRWTDTARRRERGRPWLAVAVGPEGYLVRFAAESIDFVVSPSGRRIVGHAPARTPPNTLRHLLLDQVVPLVLSQRGRLVMHASGNVAASGAFTFLGPTLSGKSTLAASFADAGVPLLADDAVVVTERGGRVSAVPAYPGVRIWPDAIAALARRVPARRVAHYTAKRRLDLQWSAVGAGRGVPLKRVYLLDRRGRGAAIHITPLTARERAVALLHNTFLMDLSDRARLTAHLDRTSRCAAVIDVRRLVYPRDLAALPAVRAAVLADLVSI